MTKREICERLLEIRDQFSAGHLGPVRIKDALRDLLLDLAAPETEEEKKAAFEARCRAVFGDLAAPKETKKEPPVLIYEEKGEKATCPVCGAPALPIKNTQGVFYCKRCEGFFNCPEEGK